MYTQAIMTMGGVLHNLYDAEANQFDKGKV